MLNISCYLKPITLRHTSPNNTNHPYNDKGERFYIEYLRVLNECDSLSFVDGIIIKSDNVGHFS